MTTTNEHHSIANKVAVLIWGSRESNDIIIIANEVRSDVFNYIEFFYNPNRPHGHNDGKPD